MDVWCRVVTTTTVGSPRWHTTHVTSVRNRVFVDDKKRDGRPRVPTPPFLFYPVPVTLLVSEKQTFTVNNRDTVSCRDTWDSKTTGLKRQCHPSSTVVPPVRMLDTDRLGTTVTRGTRLDRPWDHTRPRVSWVLRRPPLFGSPKEGPDPGPWTNHGRFTGPDTSTYLLPHTVPWVTFTSPTQDKSPSKVGDLVFVRQVSVVSLQLSRNRDINSPRRRSYI